MRASDLRHKIIFQTPTTASDSMGGKTASAWNSDYTTWAMVTSTGSEVSYENGQTRGVKSFSITTRYAKDYTMTHETRILWGSRILTPSVTMNIDHIKKWMTFDAKEYTS